MGNWGISPNASEKEKIKADYADILHGMNSVGAITYDVYCDLFDDGMELFDRMYEQGKADAVPDVEPERPKGRWKYYHKQNIAVCTNCSFERKLDADFGKAITCPNCGADMRGESE